MPSNRGEGDTLVVVLLCKLVFPIRMREYYQIEEQKEYTTQYPRFGTLLKCYVFARGCSSIMRHNLAKEKVNIMCLKITIDYITLSLYLCSYMGT